MTGANNYIINKANLSDSFFLGTAIRDVERAQTGTGIWDIVADGSIEISAVLEHACFNDKLSHFHISKFLIARESVTLQPVACACAFIYPDFSVTKSKPGVTRALKELNNWSDEQCEEGWKRIDFLENSFPEYDGWDNTWMIDNVYTSPEHRGKGLAAALIKGLIEEGKKTGCKKSLLTCAVGNIGAKRVYEKLGFVLIGEGNSDLCSKALGSSGFWLLGLDL